MYVLLCSQSLQLTTDLIFTYVPSADGEKTVQRHEIIKPLPNVKVSNGTNSTEVTVTAVRAGTVIVGLSNTSVEFDE